MRPFAGDQWWPLAVSLLSVVGCLALAAALASRRDLGAGLVQPRRGRAGASRMLASPLGLAVRLQRGPLLAWATGVFVLGAVYAQGTGLTRP